jgi:hypothetical protein
MTVVGAFLWLSPVATLALAPKYQGELSPGIGYLPVLIQSFGWALVAAAALLAAIRMARARSVLAGRLTVLGGAALLGLGAGVTGYGNVRVVALEVPKAEAADLFQTAPARGLLRAFEPGSTVLIPETDLGSPVIEWRAGNMTLEAMLLDETGRLYDARIMPPFDDRYNCEPAGGLVPSDCEPVRPSAGWMRIGVGRDVASVVMSRIAGTGSRSPAGAPARWLYVYVEGDGTPEPPLLAGIRRDGTPWRSDGVAWQPVRRGDGWAIYQAPGPPDAVAADTIRDAGATVDFTADLTSAERVRILGTKRVLP